MLQSLRERGIPEAILLAFSEIEREDFIPADMERMAYEDIPLPIGKNQTTSQPYTIALMLSLLDVKQGQKVLEIGSGSGYVLALLSKLAGPEGKVFGVELVKETVKKSRKTLQGTKNIKVYNKNGAGGLPEFAPFDRILISAALRDIPEGIIAQLADHGILVAPKGSRFEQEILVIERKSGSEFEIKKRLPGFVFVPFIGEDSGQDPGTGQG